MGEYIRELSDSDLPSIIAMDTGIKNDYVIRVFNRVSTGSNRLYGLFIDEQLISIAGYSIFAHRYAMLGRLRSDQQFRGRNYATRLMAFVRDVAFQLPHVTWVGGNTQENNPSARRVLTNIGLTESEKLYPALSQNIETLIKNVDKWKLIKDSKAKRKILYEAFVYHEQLFSYECYNPFPATNDLFTEANIENWNIYQSPECIYPLVTKKDVKDNTYLQVIYPFSDLFSQPGLWETVYDDYQALQLSETDKEVYIWLDIPEQHIHNVPVDHPFHIDSPWILHGMNIDTWKKLNKNSGVS